jgi:hypothetical protein
MADYASGGNDDETAELKKLNAEVVHHRPPFPTLPAVADLRPSSKMATTTKLGRSWFAPQNLSMEA